MFFKTKIKCLTQPRLPLRGRLGRMPMRAATKEVERKVHFEDIAYAHLSPVESLRADRKTTVWTVLLHLPHHTIPIMQASTLLSLLSD